MRVMRRIQSVDLFAGGGGATEGMKSAGAEVVLAVDCWDPAIEVHKLNYPNIPILNIELGGCIYETGDLIREYLDPDVHFHLHGSPPCTNITRVNPKADKVEGMRLVNWFFDLVEYLNPDSWSMENVVGIGKYLDDDLKWLTINSANYGVAQTRRRVFAGSGWNDPTPSHNESQWVSMKDALNLDPSWHLDSGRGNSATCGINPRTGKQEGGRGKLYRSVDKPSYTITSSSLSLVDDDKNKMRTFTIEEVIILMGLPSSYQIPSTMTKTTAMKILGNMVSPPVIKAIIEAIR